MGQCNNGNVKIMKVSKIKNQNKAKTFCLLMQPINSFAVKKCVDKQVGMEYFWCFQSSTLTCCVGKKISFMLRNFDVTERDKKRKEGG